MAAFIYENGSIFLIVMLLFSYTFIMLFNFFMFETRAFYTQNKTFTLQEYP